MDKEVQVEHFKQQVAYIKHLTTLSTGSIVILATFIQDIFPKHTWESAIVTSISGFMFSILASTVLYTLTILFDSPVHINSDTPSWSDGAVGITLICTWLGFLVGIFSLGTFAIMNFI